MCPTVNHLLLQFFIFVFFPQPEMVRMEVVWKYVLFKKQKQKHYRLNFIAIFNF